MNITEVLLLPSETSWPLPFQGITHIPTALPTKCGKVMANRSPIFIVAAGTRGEAGALTCTFHSLSNEAPHEVGTVFTPVWPSERMDLEKEWSKVEKGETWGGCCASIKGALHKLAELKMQHAHLENRSSGTDKWHVFSELHFFF